MFRRRFEITAPRGWTFVLMTGLFIVQAATAHAANAISRAVEQAQPCRTVKTTKLGVPLGIDKFKDAQLESLTINVNGDDAKIAAVGSLACPTSDAAVVRGDASARWRRLGEIQRHGGA